MSTKLIETSPYFPHRGDALHHFRGFASLIRVRYGRLWVLCHAWRAWLVLHFKCSRFLYVHISETRFPPTPLHKHAKTNHNTIPTSITASIPAPQRKHTTSSRNKAHSTSPQWTFFKTNKHINQYNHKLGPAIVIHNSKCTHTSPKCITCPFPQHQTHKIRTLLHTTIRYRLPVPKPIQPNCCPAPCAEHRS